MGRKSVDGVRDFAKWDPGLAESIQSLYKLLILVVVDMHIPFPC